MKERKRITNRQWYLRNQDRRKQYLKEWRDKNPDWNKKWKKDNSARMLFLWKRSNRKRQHLMAQIGGSHSLGEWEALKAQYNWTCPSCKREEPLVVLTEDHVIPISKGGSDNIENIQPLCRSCNSTKNTRVVRFDL